MSVYKMFRTILNAMAFVVFELDSIKCMESLIVGGLPAKIEYFSHSAFLSMVKHKDTFVCGASIINQNVVLSAAHCFEDVGHGAKIVVRAGSANKLQGSVRYGSKIAIHKDYNADTVTNDIALLHIKKPFVLGVYVKRVILLKNPPRSSVANVAGWGLINERKYLDTNWLHYTQQKLWSRNECMKHLFKTPVGSICGGSKNSDNYASSGDSGSALVIDGSIQIGLVSFKRPEISRAVVVYTDVPFFYDWIIKTSKRLHCH